MNPDNCLANCLGKIIFKINWKIVMVCKANEVRSEVDYCIIEFSITMSMVISRNYSMMGDTQRYLMSVPMPNRRA